MMANRTRTPRLPGRNPSVAATKSLLRDLPTRSRLDVYGGETLILLVLGSTIEDTICVDLSTGAVLRLRVPWPQGYPPDLAPFDVIEATLADDPEGNDLAQPEAVNGASTLFCIRRSRPRWTVHCSDSVGRLLPTGSSPAIAPRWR